MTTSRSAELQFRLLQPDELAREKAGIQRPEIGSQTLDDGGQNWDLERGWSPLEGWIEVYTFHQREAELDAAGPGFDLPTAPSVRYWPYPA
jgi:hypothetical protein